MSSLEIRALRAEIEALRLRVQVLEEKAADQEERGAEAGERGSEAEVGSRGCGASVVASSSYSVVTSFPVAPATYRGQTGQQETGLVEAQDTQGRLALARAGGAFLARAIQGKHRGTSGRDRLPLKSEFYIVLANFQGEVFPEPKIFKDFSSVRALCKRGSDCGKSVFVGYPTEWEAQAAVEAAGYKWPVRH